MSILRFFWDTGNRELLQCMRLLVYNYRKRNTLIHQEKLKICSICPWWAVQWMCDSSEWQDVLVHIISASPPPGAVVCNVTMFGHESVTSDNISYINTLWSIHHSNSQSRAMNQFVWWCFINLQHYLVMWDQEMLNDWNTEWLLCIRWTESDSKKHPYPVNHKTMLWLWKHFVVGHFEL